MESRTKPRGWVRHNLRSFVLRHRGVHAVTIMLLAGSVPYYGVSALPLFAVELQEYFGLSLIQLGLLFSIGIIPGTIASALGGISVDIWGARRILRFCLIGVSIGAGLMAVGVHWTLMLLAVVVYKVSFSSLEIGSSKYITRLVPERRRRYLTINLLIGSAAAMLIPLLVELLLWVRRANPAIEFKYVLHGPFALLAVVVVVGAALVLRRGPVAGRAAKRSVKLKNWRDLILPLPTVILVIMLASHWTCDAVFAAWMPRFLASKSFGTMLIVPGIIISLRALAYVVSRIILACLPENFGRRALIIVPGILGGTIFVVCVLLRRYEAMVIGFPLAAFCWSVQCPVLVAKISHRSPENLGSALGVVSVVSGVGSFALINAIGALAAYLGEQKMWIAMMPLGMVHVAIGVTGAIWTLVWGRKETVSNNWPRRKNYR